MKLLWALVAVSALIGGAIGVLGSMAANGAPQEAAAAAIGCVIAIAPYVFARAVQECSASR